MDIVDEKKKTLFFFLWTNAMQFRAYVHNAQNAGNLNLTSFYVKSF